MVQNTAGDLLGESIRRSTVLVIILPILAFLPACSTNDYQNEHLRLMVATVDSGRLGPAGFKDPLSSHLIFWRQNSITITIIGIVLNIDSGMLVILIVVTGNC